VKYIECLTCCVDYADYLAEIEPFVRPVVDRWLIISTPADEETRDFCRRRGLECVLTTDFFRNGADFDKARGIDLGLQHLSHRDWVLHLDADCLLPPHFRESLEDADLDPACLHTFDRFEVVGWEKWQRLKASGYFQQHSRSAHHNVCFPEGFPIGARWADTVQGWCPVGFAQLFHSDAVMWRGIRHRRYPTYGHSDAARTDVQFSLLWPRRQRVLVPEIIVAHLMSERTMVGANWRGRTTKRFSVDGGPPPRSRVVPPPRPYGSDSYS
jgi:hypothetical protein